MPDPSLLDTSLRIAELLAVLGGGGIFIFKSGRTASRFEQVVRQQSLEIGELKTGVQAIQKLITQNAVMDERLVNMGTSISRLEDWYDELRRGEGFVFPLGAYQAKA